MENLRKASFEEQLWRPQPPLEREFSKAAAKALNSKVGSIGTEYGRELDSHVYYVPFLRSANRQAVTIY